MRPIDADRFCKDLEEIRMEYLEEDTLSSNFAAEVIETVQACYLKDAPTLDYKDLVPQGEWVTDYKHGGIHNCSVCGEWCGGGGCTRFCPNCGARMKGAD